MKNGEPVPVGNVGRGASVLADYDLSDATFDAARPDPGAVFPRDVITKLVRRGERVRRRGRRGFELCGPSRSARYTSAVSPHCAQTASPRRACSSSNRLAAISAFCPISRTSVTRGARHRRSNISRPASLSVYLTQIGRYATIMKYDLERYAIAQRTAFGFANAHPATRTILPSADAVHTHVEIDVSGRRHHGSQDRQHGGAYLLPARRGADTPRDTRPDRGWRGLESR